ncbi:MAG: MoxR family ATPase [Candidatus Tectomicrobia bacterium]|nr:MoxR family ATPase [Candidatus Tectomicrobia bacterium]
MTETAPGMMSEEGLAAIHANLRRVREEIGKVIVGHEDLIEGVITCLLCGGHALLEGAPGLGKTLLVKSLGEALDLTFSRIQFTPDLMPADILGTTMVLQDEQNRKYFEFQRGPIFAHIVLADEINRATPKTQSALLEAMQERSVTIGGVEHRLQEPFIVLATQNPIEMEGTYPLPEAQIDRFFMKLDVKQPSFYELRQIIDRTTRAENHRVRSVLSAEEILGLRQVVRSIPLATPVRDYAIRLILATQPEHESGSELTRRYVRYGSSPRGAQSLVLGAKMHALLRGRLHVGFEDVRAVALPSLRHRLILNFEGEAEGVHAEGIIRELLRSVAEAP